MATLLEKAQSKGIQPKVVVPTATNIGKETLLQKAQRLGIKPKGTPKETPGLGGGFLSAVGGGIKDIGIGAAKEVAGTLQGLGKIPLYAAGKATQALTGSDVLTKSALESGFKPETLEATNTLQKIGKGLGFAAEMLAPGLGTEGLIEKIGVEGLKTAAQKGLLSPESLKSISNIVASKWGRATLNAISDFTIGGTQAAAADLSAGKEPTVKDVAIGGTTSAILGGVTRKLTKPRTPEGATDVIKSTEQTLSKKQRLDAINSGRLKSTITGGKEYLPTDTEKRAGELLVGKITNNPVKNVPIIKNEISKLGKQAEKYLSENAKSFTAEEQSNLLSGLRKEAEQYMTKAELAAYDEQVKLFQKQLLGRGGFTTDNLYKALKTYESNVAEKLAKGMAALLDPTGAASAKLHAASDIRKAVRDFIGQVHPEFKNKMFDLASLFDAKDNVMTMAEQLSGNAVTRFAKEHPAITGVGTFLGLEEIKKDLGLGY